ncbi:MAG: ATP-grasp domain-containing protein [Actinobacteria bacterium]|nr:ATP-grasp domain-containing protein [Actinomycetota bacterium]
MFARVLVANRGEIACRVLRTLARLGIHGIAVYSDADAEAKHVRDAPESVRIGESPAPLSYLNPAAIIDVARLAGVEAIHPGYGFLSENAMFARACADAGIAFIGPPPEVLELCGDKVAARKAFDAAAFPVLPGGGPYSSAEEAVAASEEIGFPVMVKATSGGGGIGMGIAQDPAELAKQVETASTRGERFFADPTVYLERYVPSARHIEVQILADDARTIHVYERECSVQRRHQKVIEETPSPALTPAVRRELFGAAVRSMESIGYRGAGTVECVLSPDKEFFFLEVNARIQVEHPVTEMTTALDLVEEQLRIASGEGMSVEATPPRNGHAIECRVYAEDPKSFLPAPGTIAELRFGASAEGVRYDFGYATGDSVPMFYDPLIGKVVAHAEDRDACIAATRKALAALRLEGLKTNVPALAGVLEDERFTTGEYDTGLLGR